jgi:hypothetical protein
MTDNPLGWLHYVPVGGDRATDAEILLCFERTMLCTATRQAYKERIEYSMTGAQKSAQAKRILGPRRVHRSWRRLYHP